MPSIFHILIFLASLYLLRWAVIGLVYEARKGRPTDGQNRRG